MGAFKTRIDLKRYVKAGMLREIGTPEHVITFVMEQMDEMYLIGHNHGMCDTCKKTGQVRRSAGPYDLSNTNHPARYKTGR